MQVDTVTATAPSVDEPASDPPSLPLPRPQPPACGQDVDVHDCGLADPSQLDTKMLRNTLCDEDHENGPARDSEFVWPRLMRGLIRLTPIFLDRLFLSLAS